MFKLFVKNLWALLLRPEETWEALARHYESKEGEDLQVSIFYPSVVFLSLVSFIAGALRGESFSFALGMRSAVATLLVCLFAFYASLYFLSFISSRWFRISSSKRSWEAFLLYCYAPIFVVMLLSILSVDFVFVIFLVLVLYLTYLVWQGCVSYWGIPEDRRLWATLLYMVTLFGAIFLARGAVARLGLV